MTDERNLLLSQLEWLDDNTLKGELDDDEMEARMDTAYRIAKEYEAESGFFRKLLRFSRHFTYRGMAFRLDVSSVAEEGEDGPKLQTEKDARITAPGRPEPLHFALLHTDCFRRDDFVEREDYRLEGTLRERVEKLLKLAMDDIDWLHDKAENDIRKHAEMLLEELKDATEDLDEEIV